MPDRWCLRRTTVLSPRARLVCLPHAGGAAALYASWLEHVPHDVELIAIELPGRGSRFDERPIHDFDELFEALDAALIEVLDATTVLFGHSLGALLAFELARRRTPRALVVSGCRAPQRRTPDRRRSTLSNEALVREIAALGGTPAEVLAHAELMDLMLPVLRADFSVSESYRYRSGPPIPCPLIALGGTRDAELTAADIEAWGDLAGSRFRCQSFEGDHFFFRGRERQVVSWLLDEALA